MTWPAIWRSTQRTSCPSSLRNGMRGGGLCHEEAGEEQDRANDDRRRRHEQEEETMGEG